MFIPIKIKSEKVTSDILLFYSDTEEEYSGNYYNAKFDLLSLSDGEVFSDLSWSDVWEFRKSIFGAADIGAKGLAICLITEDMYAISHAIEFDTIFEDKLSNVSFYNDRSTEYNVIGDLINSVTDFYFYACEDDLYTWLNYQLYTEFAFSEEALTRRRGIQPTIMGYILTALSGEYGCRIVQKDNYIYIPFRVYSTYFGNELLECVARYKIVNRALLEEQFRKRGYSLC